MGMPLALKSLAEFLAWEQHQDERHEFYRGETYAMVGGTARHNRVVLNIASRISAHLEGTACQVFTETMKVQIADGILYPDVLATCGKATAGEEQVISDPKLIVEVLSPSTKGYDQRDKFILYRTLASLQEYVLVDPADRRVEIFTLADAASQRWTMVDRTGADEIVLASIDLVLPTEAVFRGVESTHS